MKKIKQIKSKYKLLISIIILFFVTSLNQNIYAKYVIENTYSIGNIKLIGKAPTATIEYSTIEPTSENVIVKIKLNKQVQRVEGWSLSEDKNELEKEYQENKAEQVAIKDLVGNVIVVDIVVNNIDKEKPKIELIEINYTNEKNENEENTIFVQKINYRIKIIEENIIVNKISPNNLHFQINKQDIVPQNITMNVINEEKDGIIYEITVSGIEQNGILTLVIKDSIIMDSSGLVNDEKTIEANVIISNSDNFNNNITTRSFENDNVKILWNNKS